MERGRDRKIRRRNKMKGMTEGQGTFSWMSGADPGGISWNLSSLTTVISYWNSCIWLAGAKLISEKRWQNTWWNAPQDFDWGGGGGGGAKNYVRAPREVPTAAVQGPLSCYLSLIFKHSDITWDRKTVTARYSEGSVNPKVRYSEGSLIRRWNKVR